MTDDERQRAMDFIVEQTAKNSVAIDKLLETQRENEHRFDRDERILKLIIRAGRHARRDLRERDKYWTRRHAELMESQAHSDRRLDALIDIVRADRNGRSQ